MLKCVFYKTGKYSILDTSNGIIKELNKSEIISTILNGIKIQGLELHTINKGYKFRLYPNKKQEIYFQKCFGCCRFLWNNMLADKIEYYEKYKSFLDTQPPYYKNKYSFLREVDSLALTSEYRNLSAAFKNFFQYEKVGYPKFKSKKKDHKSYTTYNQGGNIRFEGNKIILPKIKGVKVKKTQEIFGEIKNVTISQSSSEKYFITMSVEVYEIKLPKSDKKIGIDLGLKDFVITSNGERFKNIKPLQQLEIKLIKAQKKLLGMQKGSNNWYKQKKKYAKIHEKIHNIRMDYIHKVTTKLIQENQLIASELLDVKNMLKDRKFAKSIIDISWAETIRQLAYKANWYGRDYIQVDTFFASSQLCSSCGYKNKNIKNLRIRKWICPSCGQAHDRDENASLNILNEGLRIFANRKVI